MNDSQEQNGIAAFFDSCARQGLMADFTPKERSRITRLLARWNVKPGMRILEPGCGSGRLTRILSEAVGPGGLVMALDMSEEMLRRAAQRATLPNTSLRKGSVYGIPSEDGFFDQVICFCAFPHFTRKREALREMARVLRPGGSLCISHLSGRETLNRFHRDTRSIVSNHLLPAGEEMRGMVEAAGLRVEHLKDTDEEFCLHAVKDTPMRTRAMDSQLIEQERREFWGTTGPSVLCCTGFFISILGALLLYHPVDLIMPVAGIIMISWGIIWNLRQGLNVKWRKVNLGFHIVFLAFALLCTIAILMCRIA